MASGLYNCIRFTNLATANLKQVLQRSTNSLDTAYLCFNSECLSLECHLTYFQYTSILDRKAVSPRRMPSLFIPSLIRAVSGSLTLLAIDWLSLKNQVSIDILYMDTPHCHSTRTITSCGFAMRVRAADALLIIYCVDLHELRLWLPSRCLLTSPPRLYRWLCVLLALRFFRHFYQTRFLNPFV